MIQKKLEQNEMSKKLVDVTVQLIEEQGGLQGVNLRQIAKRANCAHTNIYNYYQDFEDLLWDVFARIETLWAEAAIPQINAGLPIDELVERVTRIQIEFAVAHPGWYRCLWSEPLSRKPSQAVRDARRQSRDEMVRFILQSYPDMEPARGNNLFMILFGYVHGSISLLINGRIYRSSLEEYQEKIVQNTLLLLCTLKHNNEPQE